MPDRPLALIKGAGDLATGVAIRLLRAGFAVVMTETETPTVVRRTVAFADAVFSGSARVEGLEAVLARSDEELQAFLSQGKVPVIVDPEAKTRLTLRPPLLVDAIVAKRNLGTCIMDAPAVVALGPGFAVGRDVHAVVETMRGHTLGRVIWEGEALPNTGVPGEVGGFGAERVMRAPIAGVFRGVREIGDTVEEGDVVGFVGVAPVASLLHGGRRGLLRSGIPVTTGFKLGDVDPRATREHCFLVSDKALAIAGGVLEAACSLLGGVRFAV